MFVQSLGTCLLCKGLRGSNGVMGEKEKGCCEGLS